ncbi:MAG: 7-carboxy-7-deazaguanine synthase QueE, partial [Moraxella sp.]
SQEADKNLWQNIPYLTAHDQIKFVIMNRDDYDWSKQILADYQLDKKVATVWFSPMFNVEERQTNIPTLATDLAEWILADALPVRFQLQLHKIIWADAKGK